LIVAATAIGDAQAPVSIGLVREDGYLVPIAVITPGLFAEPPFPAQTTVHGEPLDPPVEPDRPSWPFNDLGWTLSYGRGKAPIQIKTLEPLTVDSHCMEQVVWRTTLKLPPARKNVAPIYKIGIAVSATGVEHPEDVVNQPDAASRRVVRRIVALTHSKEAERLKEIPKNYLPAGASADRQKVAVRVRLLRRHSAAGVPIYYFEATKAWGLAPEGGLVTGWIVDRPSGMQEHDVKYKFNDDGAKEGDNAIVWGVIPYDGRALWILEWHGYEWEYYTVHDWPSGVERLRVDGGGC